MPSLRQQPKTLCIPSVLRSPKRWKSKAALVLLHAANIKTPVFGELTCCMDSLEYDVEVDGGSVPATPEVYFGSASFVGTQLNTDKKSAISISLLNKNAPTAARSVSCPGPQSASSDEMASRSLCCPESPSSSTTESPMVTSPEKKTARDVLSMHVGGTNRKDTSPFVRGRRSGGSGNDKKRSSLQRNFFRRSFRGDPKISTSSTSNQENLKGVKKSEKPSRVKSAETVRLSRPES